MKRERERERERERKGRETERTKQNLKVFPHLAFQIWQHEQET